MPYLCRVPKKHKNILSMKHLYTTLLLFCVSVLLPASVWAEEASFDFLRAYSLAHTDQLASDLPSKAGDFCFELTQSDDSENEESIYALLYVSTATRSTLRIAGAYRIGEIGIYSYVYPDAETTQRLVSGTLFLECVGDTVIEAVPGKEMTLPLYRIRLIDGLTTDGQTVAFEGKRIPGFGIDKQYYDENKQDSSRHTDDWFFFPMDQVLNTIDLELPLINFRDYTYTNGTWHAQGLDVEEFPEGNYYEVVIVAASRTILGAVPSVLTVGNNGSPLTCVYRKNEIEANIQSGYGIVYEKDGSRIYEFYLFAEERAYHLLMTLNQAYSLAGDTDEAMQQTFTRAYIEKEAGMVYVSAENDEAATELLFYVDDIDPVTILPEGTYTISQQRKAGMMQASPGVDQASYNLAPSYLTTLDEEGYADQMAFLQTGTATVSTINDQLYIEVEAENTHQKTILIHISYTPTALDDIFGDKKAELHKYLNADGQLIILRNGIRYNIQGQIIR